MEETIKGLAKKKYKNEADVIHRKIGYREGEAISLCNIGSIYGGKGNEDEAEKYLKEGLKIFEKYGLTQGSDMVREIFEKIEKRRIDIGTWGRPAGGFTVFL